MVATSPPGVGITSMPPARQTSGRNYAQHQQDGALPGGQIDGLIGSAGR